jgi:hypothetical protein
MISMNDQRSAIQMLRVMLVRPGIDARDYLLPAGSTVGDLLEKAQVDARGRDVVILNQRVDESAILSPESFVYVVATNPNGHDCGSWQDLVGAFRGDPVFREIVEAGRALRDAERDDP